MPQLNPAPWLAIFTFSWLIFLVLIPPKVLAQSFLNEPVVETKHTKTNPWNWPWH
uniref:ATP synthase F0 subunit 8 n=1 Tax=Malacosteus niger TaxID=76143 RepID=UPI0023AAD1AC|nr:ATP synthase F0 subunit 8 [Malacosteus niger]WCK11525.1 ATP synthase F0 subunit 8 [Malacosteus niger]